MVHAILEEEDEAEPLPFVGYHSADDGQSTILSTLRILLDVNLKAYRAERSSSDAFNLLRRNIETSGIFVLLKGDLGNYVTTIDTRIFRGFSISDSIAPFVIINDNDARSAWSFTLLHEMVHILLGQTGVSGDYSENEVERFCDDVAGNFLLPTDDLDRLAIHDSDDTQIISERIGNFADKVKVSRTMVAYRAYRHSKISQKTYNYLSDFYRREWHEQREHTREQARSQDGGPSYYTVRRHRLGNRIIDLTSRMVAGGALSTSRAARILGVKPRQVYPLLDSARSL